MTKKKTTKVKKVEKIHSNKIKRMSIGDQDLLDYIESLKHEINYLKLQIKQKEELIHGVTLLLIKEVRV